MRNSVLFLLLVPLFSIAQDQCKCCSSNHKAFDFWVGEWEVFLPNGTKAGENTITKIENNCIVKENWTSANAGYTGTSYNFYNAKTGLWEQLWIDNQGQHLKLKGNREGNQMLLISVTEIDNGKSTYNKITWTLNADGTVRQLWENISISDGKETVKILFDGLYQKKGSNIPTD